MAKKTDPRKGTNPASGETEVELHLPANLYAVAKKLYDTESVLFSELVRSVFSRDDLYGITKVVLVQKTHAKKVSRAKDPKKTCDVGPMP